MKIVAAYLLAVLGGNANPSAADLKDILGCVGAEAEDERITFLLSEVKGKDITELIASGREKFSLRSHLVVVVLLQHPPVVVSVPLQHLQLQSRRRKRRSRRKRNPMMTWGSACLIRRWESETFKDFLLSV